MSTTISANTKIQVEGASGSTTIIQLITIRSALGFEIKCPGMRATRTSALAVAQRVTGCSRSKKAAWTAVNDLIIALGGESKPRPW